MAYETVNRSRADASLARLRKTIKMVLIGPRYASCAYHNYGGMDDILHGLNPAQHSAVTSSSSVLQVLAPPGSGKTKTLTARVAYLISHYQLKPWNIITCTFTKKAANEMKERIRGFVGEELARQIKLGTFHAIAVVYLRQYGQHIGLEKDFGIADSSDSKAILKRITKKLGVGLEPGPTLGRISAQKVKSVDLAELAHKSKRVDHQEFAHVFAEYEAELKQSNLLDYDDLLLRCCDLMRQHPECVANVEAVLIDEFQDTNCTQYELMSLFAQRRNVITIVGDPDQSIYGFRHAEIQNLKRMKQHWPDTLTINLEENYRSSGAILHAAQHIIEQDESRPPKKLQATHSPGLRPVLRKLPSSSAEASWLVSEVKRMISLSAQVLRASDIAILLRSAALSRVIESALVKEKVPYCMVGGLKFFERAEVKLILDYLRVIDQPSNNEAFERIVNVPPRRIGDATIASLREEARSKGMSLWHLTCGLAQGRSKVNTKLSPGAEKGLASFVNVILCGQNKIESAESEQFCLVDLIMLVVKKIDLQAYLKNKYENEHEARWSNVEELVAQAADLSEPEKLKTMLEAESLPVIDDLDQRQSADRDVLSMFLANVALTASARQRAETDGEPVQQVTISTIHSAKGLEWPVVFIPACFEGSIPHSRSDDNDEERRLLYVGMTRAQAMLYLSCPMKNTQREDTTMSSYLTGSGVSSFFEEHGPAMSLYSAKGLAATLKRDEPCSAAFELEKKSLERDEDNYWPLNGEEPLEELAKWDHGKATASLLTYGNGSGSNWKSSTSMSIGQHDDLANPTAPFSSGFLSVKAQYDDLVEQSRLKSIDKRAADSRKKSDLDLPQGRKRQIEGQGTISGFFAKRRHVESTEANARSSSNSIRVAPLRDMSNLDRLQTAREEAPAKPPVSTIHKPRTAPMRPQALPHSPTSNSTYVFLSSSPPQPENDENLPAGTIDDTEQEATVKQPAMRAATTFHSTSMQTLSHQNVMRGRRYGVKPSFNGWANRINR